MDFFDLDTILATASSLDFDTLPWHGDEQYLVFEEFGRLVVGPRARIQPRTAEVPVSLVALEQGMIVARIWSERAVAASGIGRGDTYWYLDREGECPRPRGVACTDRPFRSFSFSESFGDLVYECLVELMQHEDDGIPNASWEYVDPGMGGAIAPTFGRHIQTPIGCIWVRECNAVRWRTSA